MKKSYLLVFLSYLLACLVAWAAILVTSELHILIRILIADVFATVVIFLFSVGFKNSSFYDPYWSIVPVFIALYMIFQNDLTEFIRELLVAIVVGLWGLRLTANWLYSWKGLGHVDWRYTLLEKKSGRFFWVPVNFFGIHLAPTIIVFLACVPFYSITVSGMHPINWLDFLAFIVGLASVWIEFQSDKELHRFRAIRSDSSNILETGTWSWCRHPNYLGELGFWFSIFLFGVAAGEGLTLLALSGPIIMLLLFVFISIPMIEQKLLEDKPGYQKYMSKTFTLLPVSKLFFKTN
tara:strand:- start:367 stop:1245 length:879 start_codon:yes stop_codon:yes gene_type:complete